MIAMDLEFLSGKFRVEWNDGRFVVIADKLEVEPRDILEIAEFMREFYFAQMIEDDCCEEEGP